MRVVYTRPDGGVTVVIPAEGITLERVMERSIPADAINVKVLNYRDMPQDRILRDAWTIVGDSVVEDMDKSRQILRTVRNSHLEALDLKAFAESRKPNGKLQEINTKAQTLRDITLRPEFNSNNPQDIKDLLVEMKELISE